MFLTRGATRNPVFVLMASIAVVVLSQIAVSRLPTDLFPRISIPAMTVVTNCRGASPEAVERTVTYPIEQALTRVPGVQQILSSTGEGLSDIDVWFDRGTDLNTPRWRSSRSRRTSWTDRSARCLRSSRIA